MSVNDIVLINESKCERITDYLIHLSDNIFKQLIQGNEEFLECSLVDIANYQNGLAMQKYRPNEDEPSLPVLKIRELNMGYCDSQSDFCKVSIKNECIVDDGDIIFSWSGSLMIDIWSGGKCGLNQHIFKVTSKKYPSWFIYHWTNYYLDDFKAIAKDKATTMGHICRTHLEDSIVLCPYDDIIYKWGEIMQPMFDMRTSIKLQTKILRNVSNELLPKLMSGEIDISKLDLCN